MSKQTMIDSDYDESDAAAPGIMDDADKPGNRNNDYLAHGAGFALIDRILVSLAILLFLLNVGAQLYKLYIK